MSKTHGSLFLKYEVSLASHLWDVLAVSPANLLLNSSGTRYPVSTTAGWHPVGKHVWHECYGYVGMFNAVPPSRTCQTLPQPSGTFQTNLQNLPTPSGTLQNQISLQVFKYLQNRPELLRTYLWNPPDLLELQNLSDAPRLPKYVWNILEPSEFLRTLSNPPPELSKNYAQTFQIDLELFNRYT